MGCDMSFLYLVRSGLGIPDYWHPHLEVQKDFLSGKIARYPTSMDVKADYPGQIDDEGVPVVFWNSDGTASPSPVNIILYGLGSHDIYLRGGDKRYLSQFQSASRWLANHHVPLGNGIGWSHDVDMPVFKLRAPWFSGIVQGLALSLFVRAHQLDSNSVWSELAYQTWLGFQLPIESGGFHRAVNEGVIFEEYPSPKLDCVFNGMCHALIGLWEVSQSGLVKQADADFRAGLNALRSYLPRFDHKGWSLYSLSQSTGSPHLASPYYVRANAVLAQVIGLIANDPEFTAYGDRWLRTSQSVARRIAMSVRIGIDRYRHAPALLHTDKTRKRERLASN